MAIYTNVVQEFRKDIEAQLNLNDVIDTLISQRLIDEKLYTEIWNNHNNRVGFLLDVIIKDGKRCSKFIEILATVSHLKTISKSIKDSIDKIHRMIVIGGFPEFSKNYVVRNSVANTIKQKALNLDPKIGGTLVVHGLPGFGKTCLVNQVLQTRKFYDVSGGVMFWINLGEYNDTTAVISPLWNLYLTAIQLTNQIPLLHRPDDLDLLRHTVRRLFLDDYLAKSYIILDDVKSSEVLRVFKLNCKTIVTTQDKNVESNFGADFVQVTTGFTKKESLELLRKSLDTNNLCFNDLANKIHLLCDGCPMLLNIIASILKDSREEALSTDIIWKSIIDEIHKKDYLEHPNTTRVINMIAIFVKRLHPEVQKCFHSLAVFPKHVNIRPEILQKLWNKSYFEVRDIMVELENKSLIVSFYNNDLRTYIYSIHTLVRTYLVEKVKIDIKYYHRKLVENCDYLAKLSPDDPIANYVFGYYGYHAKNGELFENFQNYFDLRFIENKIKRVGSADLLTDFDIYKDLITKKKPLLQRKLRDYIKFVNCYSAHLHISPETNIVQFAFFNDNHCVYEEAKIIASDNPDQLYFKLDPYSGIHKNFPVLKTKNLAICSCFVDFKEVLIGTVSGTIEVKLFHQYHHKSQRFEGHTAQVFHIQLHPATSKTFLSISLDGSAKLWHFVDELDPQSPKLKQSNWKNLHAPDENFHPHKTFKMQDDDFITCAAFADFDEIVTGSKSGKITRWNVKCVSVIKETALGLPIQKVCYTHDNQMIIFAFDGKIYILMRDNLMYHGQVVISEQVTNLLLLPEFDIDSNEVAVICTRKVEILDYLKKTRSFSFETDSKITASLQSTDFTLISTKKSFYIYNNTNRSFIQYKNDYGEASSLYSLSDRIAFINLDKERVERCEQFLEPNENPLVYNVKLFDCYWKDSLPIYFIVNPNNKIDIFNGHSIILTEIEIIDKITCATFSFNGKLILFGTANGKVYFYNYKNRSINSWNLVNHEEVKLIKCFDGIIVAVSINYIMMKFDNCNCIKLNTSQEVSQVFLLNNHLITIDKSYKFVLYKLFENGCYEVETPYNNAVFVVIHNEKKIFGIIIKQNDKFIINIFDWSETVNFNTIFEYKILNEPRCAAISASGKLLAIGCEDGEIKIFHLENRNCDSLVLHKKSVERLMFAPNFESILVSLGDQMAWWNLESFELSDTNVLTPSLQPKLIFNFDPWQEKKLHDTVPYLLTSTNLNGKQLQYVSASKDFRSFFVVDVDGNIFKMDIITP